MEVSELKQGAEGEVLYEEPSVAMLVVFVVGLALGVILELLFDAVAAVVRFAWSALTIVAGAVLGAWGIATGRSALGNGPSDD